MSDEPLTTNDLVVTFGKVTGPKLRALAQRAGLSIEETTRRALARYEMCLDMHEQGIALFGVDQNKNLRTVEVAP